MKLLSGNTNRLISFLEKNREINSNITSSLYLEGISEELLCDIFEFLCVENDYKLSKDAKEYLKNILKKILIKMIHFTCLRFLIDVYKDRTNVF